MLGAAFLVHRLAHSCTKPCTGDGWAADATHSRCDDGKHKGEQVQMYRSRLTPNGPFRLDLTLFVFLGVWFVLWLVTSARSFSDAHAKRFLHFVLCYARVPEIASVVADHVWFLTTTR